MDIQSILISLMGLAAGLTAGAPALEPTITGQFSNNTSFSENISLNTTTGNQSKPDVQDRSNQTNISQGNLDTGQSNTSESYQNNSAPKTGNLSFPDNRTKTANITNQTQAEKHATDNGTLTSQEPDKNTSEKLQINSSNQQRSAENFSISLSKGEAGIVTVETEASDPVWKANGEIKSSDQNADLLLENGTHNITLDARNTSISTAVSVNTNGMALVQEEFYIFKYEASRSDATNNTEGNSDIPASQKSVEPWTNISQSQAIRACKRRGEGYNLPSPGQWRKAAMLEPEEGSATDLSGNTGGAESHRNPGQTCTESPQSAWNEKYCLTGTGPQEWETPTGVHDMKGNLWEWIDKTVNVSENERYPAGETGWITRWPSDEPIEVSSSKNPKSFGHYFSAKNGLYAVRKGGAWFSGQKSEPMSTYIDRKPDDRRRSIGFRCVFEPR